MNKLTSGIIVAALVIAVFSIYWFGVRPTWIRSDCWENAKRRASEIVLNEATMVEKGYNIEKRVDYLDMRDDVMNNCLLEHGLAK